MRDCGFHKRIALVVMLFVLGIGREASALTIDFEDNFHGVKIFLPDGSSKLYPDHEIWAFTYSGIKWSDIYGDGTNWFSANGECQTYLTPLLTGIGATPVPAELRYDPFSVEPDGLHVTAALLSPAQQDAYRVGGFRRFGSGMLFSRFTFSYGKIRIVARLPSARGSFPQFLLVPENHSRPPEIDILQGMGWGEHAQQMRAGIALPSGQDGSFSQWFDTGVDLSADFHEYGLIWTPETMTGLFDGREIWHRPTPPSLGQNMYLVMALAVGGKEPFDALKIKPVGSIDPARLAAGADAIGKSYPSDMIIKSVSITPPSRD